MEKWPSFLPNPSTSLSVTVTPNTSRTSMSSGYVRQRPLSERSSNSISLSFELNDNELNLFKGFIKYAVNNGSDWFLCPVATGDGVTERQVRIVGGKYKLTYIHYMNWRVIFTADLKEIGVPDKAYWDVLYSTEGLQDGWKPLLEALELCVNGRNF